jgi:hypothetical protein
MKREELESPIEAVRRPQRLVERWAPRSGHDLAQNLLDERSASAPRAPLGEDHPKAPLAAIRSPWQATCFRSAA